MMYAHNPNILQVKERRDINDHEVDDDNDDGSNTDSGDIPETQVQETQEDEEVYRVIVDEDIPHLNETILLVWESTFRRDIIWKSIFVCNSLGGQSSGGLWAPSFQQWGTPPNAQQWGSPQPAPQWGTPPNAPQWGTPPNAPQWGTPPNAQQWGTPPNAQQ
ncbi:unnamed protein product [Microthlaspi erraticum]|uniref:Uncharacterized protein n=1 Tax=Microthlaspi erraticum TaxID=1685480 RepID=A0A6D2HYC9_9BRAS|nr:unnamed protein product [Microthlaspi erraticum]